MRNFTLQPPVCYIRGHLNQRSKLEDIMVSCITLAERMKPSSHMGLISYRQNTETWLDCWLQIHSGMDPYHHLREPLMYCYHFANSCRYHAANLLVTVHLYNSTALCCITDNIWVNNYFVEFHTNIKAIKWQQKLNDLVPWFLFRFAGINIISVCRTFLSWQKKLVFCWMCPSAEFIFRTSAEEQHQLWIYLVSRSVTLSRTFNWELEMVLYRLMNGRTSENQQT